MGQSRQEHLVDNLVEYKKDHGEPDGKIQGDSDLPSGDNPCCPAESGVDSQD